MDWLKQIAPLIGTALAGPLGGAAAAFLADKLGIEEKTVQAVTTVLSESKLTPDQIAQVRIAEIEFQKFLKQNQIDLEAVHAADRKDARDMLKVTRSRVPAVLSVFVTVGFFGILVGLMMGKLQVSDSQALLLLLGSLATAWGAVMNFWLGSTNGSQDKTSLLANSVPPKR